jgi:hypothetical protein
MEHAPPRDRHFVVLEVGRGNLAKGVPRIPADLLCESWNRRLVGDRARMQLSPGYRHTGNFLLDCAEVTPLSEVVGSLHDRLPQQFAVFSARDYCRWVDELTSQAPEPPQRDGRRATLGAVMDVNPAGGIPGLPAASEKITFADWAMPRIRAAWKYDILRADGQALDSTKREGGWGAVAKAMVSHTGGRWTARASSTLRGLAHAARSRWVH